jgi:uncharacterized RDD family membrane protein YckC
VISMLRGLTAAAIVSVLTVSAVSAQHVEIEDRGPGGNVLRIGRNYNLKQGDSVREVVVISNGATIEGVVYQNVVVVLGTVTIARTAVIEGSLAVIGGSATIQPGAKIGQDLVVVAGSLDAPREFQAGGQHIVIGTAGLGERVRGLVPWLTEGLLLGRLIVPRLEWVWVVLAVIFLMSLVVTLVLKEAIRNCADAIAKRPLGTFLMGLLVLLLIGPVSVILAASVIGIAVLPFLFCALVIAWIIGKIAVKVRIGDSIMGPQAIGSRSDLIRSFVVGFAVVGLAYMVPVLGIIVWAVVGVSGLGAATTAFTGAYRREKKGAVPKVPPPPPAPVPPVPPPPSPAPAVAPLPPVVAPPPVAAFVAPDPMVSEPSGEPGVDTPFVPPPRISAPATAAGAAAVQHSLAVFPRAGFVERAAALILDIVLVLMVNDMFDLSREGPGGLVLLLAYHIGFWMWRGATVGGMACRLRVVRVDGRPLEFVDALVRALAGLFSLAAAGIGFLWILRDPERQGWHDKIAGTYVVKVPRM